MLVIEIHVDNLEDKQASPRASETRMDANLKKKNVNGLFAKLFNKIKQGRASVE